MMWTDPNLIHRLQDGAVVVMPTDTIYGIVGLARREDVVERIYDIRKRAPSKPCIILICDENEISKFNISLTLEQKQKLGVYWPGPVSIILDCPKGELAYLHRGTDSLSFRVPDEPDLRKMLRRTGPLIAPSANVEGHLPATTILEAQKYFGDKVDLYIEGGHILGQASKIIRLDKNGNVSVIRE